ncbi:MAG TPA: hypothetical protein VHQ47_11715 [Phycisphaerae bacterium]|nr:hypothetical protein [Phycisphaerae bacterium]
MVKRNPSPQAADNAFAKKALEAIQQIDAEASRRKAEQLESLREALGNIDQRLADLSYQRQQVEEAISKITGKAAPVQRKPRGSHDELRSRLLRWLGSHPGQWYTAGDLQREFPELEGIPSVAMFLKKPISEGAVQVDKTGGNRNTKYSASA